MAIVLPARGPSDSECDSESKGTSALRISDLHRRNAAGDLAINFIHIPKNAGTSIRALCGRELVYNNHATDVKDDQIHRQLVILRHPVERFVSAFYYSMEYYRHTRHIRDLVYHYMVTPNRIIEAVRDPHHPHHMKVIAMMNNDGSQKIGRYTPPHRWIYSPQHHYVHQPQFVLLFENLQQEWPVFAQHHRLTVGDIPHQNHTRNVI